MFFSVSEIPLEELELKNELENPKAGGFVCFDGWVRDFNENKEVLMLEYEALIEADPANICWCW